MQVLKLVTNWLIENRDCEALPLLLTSKHLSIENPVCRIESVTESRWQFFVLSANCPIHRLYFRGPNYRETYKSIRQEIMRWFSDPTITDETILAWREKNAFSNFQISFKANLFEYAAFVDNIQFLEWSLHNKYLTRYPDNSRLLLWAAIDGGQIKVAKWLLDNKFFLHDDRVWSEPYRDTLLHHAISNKQIPMLEWLYKEFSWPTDVNRICYLASRYNCLEAAVWALKDGGKLTEERTFFVCDESALETMRFCVAAGAPWTIDLRHYEDYEGKYYTKQYLFLINGEANRMFST